MAYCFGIDNGDQTLHHVPEFKAKLDFAVASSVSVVYLGWRPQDSGYDFFRWRMSRLPVGAVTILVEAWEPNCRAFQFPGVFRICADAAHLLRVIPAWARGCLVWQDGPEHMGNLESEELIKSFQNEGFSTIVVATPDGELRQEALGGNPFEEHKGAWTAETYQGLGFEWVRYSAGLIALWVKNVQEEKEQ